MDWADQEHAVCLSVAGSAALEEFTLTHSAESLTEFIATLRTRFGGRPVAIALEQSRGGLIHKLMEADFLVLYPVAPMTATRYREAFAPSGAKDDPPDARLLHELLVAHREHLRPWRPDTVVARQVGLLCEHRRRRVNQATGCKQQLIAALKAYYPQALDWAGEDLVTPMACDFLVRWPPLVAASAHQTLAGSLLAETDRSTLSGESDRRAEAVRTGRRLGFARRDRRLCR
jgi:transposase